jgi:phospholipase C
MAQQQRQHRRQHRLPLPLLPLLLLLLTGSRRVKGYLQPTGDTLSKAHTGVWPRTHGDVTNHAIQLLEADGHGGVAAAFGEPATRALLFDGLRQADMGGGEFVLSMYGSAGRAGRNSFSHFYNPLTKEGFVFPIPSTQGLTLNPDPHLMMRARWEVSLMMGPMPSALDMVDWQYAMAVSAMRGGDSTAAYVHLGRALHIMQDITVPHHATDKPSGLPGSKHTEYEAMVEQLLYNVSLGVVENFHPSEGGIYCDTCPPSEFVETAANQSARFIAAATQPGTPQATQVATVLIAAAEKLTAGFMHRFAAQWKTELFTVVKISVERVKMLYKYRKKGDEEEHYLLGDGNERQADVTAVVVIDGEQHRTSTARNCNDVRPRTLLGAIDVMERNYKDSGDLVDCASVYTDGYINLEQRPTDDTEVWTFTKRIVNPAEAPPMLLQVWPSSLCAVDHFVASIISQHMGAAHLPLLCVPTNLYLMYCVRANCGPTITGCDPGRPNRS